MHRLIDLRQLRQGTAEESKGPEPSALCERLETAGDEDHVEEEAMAEQRLSASGNEEANEDDSGAKRFASVNSSGSLCHRRIEEAAVNYNVLRGAE